ncbi:hypothetical protein EPO44_11715 [bacterium]|nr:MAG: hypothetical protein EPO44_11715 [bacterium]
MIGMDLRAKFGIKDTENTGDIGNAWCMVGAASPRHGKVSDNAGMKCRRSVEFPKLDVAGSIPVARSNIFER